MFIMNLGSSITTVALPILVVQRYGFGAELSMTIALRLVPLILASGLAAWLLSKFDARWIAAISVLLSGLTTVLFPLAHDLAQLNAVSVVNGLVSIGATPAMMSLRSGVIPKDRVMRGNGLVVIAERAPQVLGPLVAAAVLSWSSVELLFAGEGVAKTLAAFLLIGLPAVMPMKGVGFFTRDNAREWTTLIRGARLQGYVVTGLFYTIAVTAMRMVLVALATSVFAAIPSALPLLLGSMAAGAVAGGLIGTQFPSKWIGWVYVLGNLFEAGALLSVGLSSSLLLSMSLLCLCGIFESVATTAFFADVQLILNSGQMGGFFALYMPGIDAAAVLGTLVGTAVVAAAGPLAGAAVVAGLVSLPLLPYLKAFAGRGAKDVKVHGG